MKGRVKVKVAERPSSQAEVPRLLTFDRGRKLDFSMVVTTDEMETSALKKS